MPKGSDRTSKGCVSFDKNALSGSKRSVAALAFFIFLLSFLSPVFANNLKISNVRLVSKNATNNTANIQFDISWDHSWRNKTNWDAVWVFARFKSAANLRYFPCALSASGTNPAGFSAGTGTGLTIWVPSVSNAYERVGAMLYRSANGNGSVSTTTVQLVWQYDTAITGSTAPGDSDDVTVAVFGLEMVYVKDGSFYLGDQTSNSSIPAGGFYQYSNTATAYLVGGSGAQSLGNSSYYLAGRGGESTQDDFDSATKTLSADFPNGYDAFYVMKYEITEGQWASFYTSSHAMATDKKTNRAIVPIRGSALWNSLYTNGEGSSYPSRACNLLTWQDICAFADWAGLRPMTELEYEKAARGPSSLTPVSGEYAWGTTAITAADRVSSDYLTGNETVLTYKANANFGGVNTGSTGFKYYTGTSVVSSYGPLRAGIFSAGGGGGRANSGAGYYGVMELTGNLLEHVVSIGSSTGRAFTGTHGDGVISSPGGFATNSDWPGHSGGEVTGVSGSGFRGGSWASIQEDYLSSVDHGQLTISNRKWANEGGCTRTNTVNNCSGYNNNQSGCQNTGSCAYGAACYDSGVCSAYIDEYNCTNSPYGGACEWTGVECWNNVICGNYSNAGDCSTNNGTGVCTWVGTCSGTYISSSYGSCGNATDPEVYGGRLARTA